MHGKEYPTVHWLEPIPDVRKRTGNDNRHSIVKIALSNLVLDMLNLNSPNLRIEYFDFLWQTLSLSLLSYYSIPRNDLGIEG